MHGSLTMAQILLCRVLRPGDMELQSQASIAILSTFHIIGLVFMAGCRFFFILFFYEGWHNRAELRR